MRQNGQELRLEQCLELVLGTHPAEKKMEKAATTTDVRVTMRQLESHVLVMQSHVLACVSAKPTWRSSAPRPQEANDETHTTQQAINAQQEPSLPATSSWHVREQRVDSLHFDVFRGSSVQLEETYALVKSTEAGHNKKRARSYSSDA